MSLRTQKYFRSSLLSTRKWMERSPDSLSQTSARLASLAFFPTAEPDARLVLHKTSYKDVPGCSCAVDVKEMYYKARCTGKLALVLLIKPQLCLSLLSAWLSWLYINIRQPDFLLFSRTFFNSLKIISCKQILLHHDKLNELE